MNINFVRATFHDIDRIIEIQNQGFYHDYKKYGECSGYNSNRKIIMKALLRAYVYLIYVDSKAIGDFIILKMNENEFFLGGLCIIPEYQNQGIGHQVMEFLEESYPGAKHWSLETPADKHRNIYFYQKHGFMISDKYYDGKVEVVLLEK